MKYEIVHIDGYNTDIEPLFTMDEEFEANTCADAYAHLQEYIKAHPSSVKKYFYRFAKNPFDGKVIMTDGYACDPDDATCWFANRIGILNLKLRNLTKKMEKKEGDAAKLIGEIGDTEFRIARWKKRSHNKVLRWLVVRWSNICDWCEWYLKDKWIEKWYDFESFCKRLYHFVKEGKDTHSIWGLDKHMLEDLRWGLKRLNEHGRTISPVFIDEEVMEANKDNPEFSLDEWYKKNYPSNEFDEKAMARQTKCYNEIIHLIDLYFFYSSHEENDKLKDILLPGTYDIPDFKKEDEEAQKCWKQIWDLVKKYGEGMWD